MPGHSAATPTKKRKHMRSGSGQASLRLKRVSEREMEWVVEQLVSSLAPDKIILFGSYAYGKPKAESDVDLLIITKSDERISVLTGQAYRAVLEKTFPVDILVRTPQWIAERLEINDSFIRDILERGRVLYDIKSRSRLD